MLARRNTMPNPVFICCGMMLLSANAFALSATSTTISDSPDLDGYYTVKIVGAGFGSAPNIVLFDDFNKQTEGQSVNLTNALIGRWSPSSSYSSVPQVISSNNDKAMQIHDFNNDQTSSGKIRQLEAIFPQKVSQIFISYSVKVPAGRFFAGSTADSEFPNVSSWKFTWISDGADAIASRTKFNLCTPTHAGKGSFMLGGNSVGYAWVDIAKSWSWHDKNYMSFGINPMPEKLFDDKKSSDNKNGLVYFQHTGKANSSLTLSKKDAPVFPVSNTKSFDRVKFPGWFGNGDTSNFDAYYDDIYVATGENAFARVELSDNENIKNSILNLTMPIVAWSDANIEFKLHKDHKNKLANFYVRVYDKNNNSITQLIGRQETGNSAFNM